MENQLRGMIMSRYPNISSFAKAMHWDRKKASRIINKLQKPSASDMEQMAECLQIEDAESFVHIFLPSVSTMWENQEAQRKDPLQFFK